ncbi:sodium- and chloride-dependent glycine transporter 1-like [Tubulanus polymorphus]|uniref:sodium- and chloride-dependent glycine transporter 1-like n=1 Tax=Tubulanus polymorphus TaxID=672921 RepID=UPI003DA22654
MEVTQDNTESQKKDPPAQKSKLRNALSKVLKVRPNNDKKEQFSDLEGNDNFAFGSKSTITTNLAPGVYSYSVDTLNVPSSTATSTRNLFDDDNSGDENVERGNWSGKLDFILSCLGFAVGLGNVWRFPYMCYRNGGGAFFIPYLIMMSLVGIPLFFMELSLGQFTSSGPLTCWGFCPIFKGIGIAMVIVSGLVCIYYNMIIAYALFYLFASFTGDLPWKHCDRSWNTKDCSLNLPLVKCNESAQVKLYNGTCYIGRQLVGIYDDELYKNITKKRRIPPSEEYYNHRMLHITNSINETTEPYWELVLCLLLAWVIVFFCLIKGIKSSGKVVYFTALFPYVVLVILFFRGVTLPNASEGIFFYIVPKWKKLLDASVWNDAAVQIFFSLSNCWGGLITLASYNKFNNNALRDTLIVTLGNCGTSIFAGFVIFSFLGYMAGIMNTTVEKVASSGAGLAFIVYPAAVTYMPVSPLWAILFFIMLLLLGLDSQFAMMETVVTAIIDKYPEKLRSKKLLTILVFSLIFFLLGLTLCTGSGPYWLQLMDSYAGGWTLLVIGLCECIGIGWIYGWDRYFSDIGIMMGRRPTIWWRMTWQFITPILIVAVLLFAWIDYSPARYGEQAYPVWADTIGWFMTISAVIWIPILIIYQIVVQKGSFVERLKAAVRVSDDWGPALPKHRVLCLGYAPDFKVYPNADVEDQNIKEPKLNNGTSMQATPDSGRGTIKTTQSRSTDGSQESVL